MAKGHSGRLRGRGSLETIPPSKLTGYLGKWWRGAVPLLRPKLYRVSDQAVSGVAPKAFIHVYERSPGTSVLDPESWPAHIAKVGNKWYPSESVTEQLMTRVGEVLGFRMARSSLMRTNEGQIRFLSRYFLKKDESLVHGADILAGYLADDLFVKKVKEEDLEREFFTFQVLCEAVRTRFPEEADEILSGLVRMIAFDALVGNQDRHLYNWGVVVHPKRAFSPYFSPIYDTARGLFWNEGDDNLGRYGTAEALKRYVVRSRPLIGWDRSGVDVNHFRLVSYIAQSDPRWASVLQDIKPRPKLREIASVLEIEFPELLDTFRRRLLFRCVELRFTLYGEAVQETGGTP